ncbi:MAG TPA: hypothetical protein VLT86_06950 [Vicinamibacterales bacterium]|nr:hypothetical protein [Vicinamibacterales bacterium]
MRRAVFTLLIVCVVFAPGVSAAQTRPTPSSPQPARRPAPPPKKKEKVGFRAYVGVDIEAMSASQSFKAVTGSSTFIGPSGGVEITNIWHTVFARVAFAHASKDGQRVFVNNGTVFPLNIPLKVGMTPIELGGGFRRVMDKKKLWTGYAGVSALFLNYSETSTGALAGDDTHQTFTGVTIFGGVDRGFHKYLMTGVEAQYRSVPNALGTAGVSQAYNETNLGGFAVRIFFGFKR